MLHSPPRRGSQGPPVEFETPVFLTGHSGTATLPGMSVEFPLTSLVVVLIPGAGVVYTSSIGGGRRHGPFAAVRWAGLAYLVNARPDGYLP
jgi:hypothetical protein